MPFEKIDVAAYIEKKLNEDPELKEIWENSRMEYDILGQLIKLRKQKGLTQKELARKIGKKQQVISRIEHKEHSPSLETLCGLARVLDVEVKLIPKQENAVK